MTNTNSKRESVQDLVWNVYLDQYEMIHNECLDGKSFSEAIRRIVDFAIERKLNESFQSKKRSMRPLKKIQINVTKKQYQWFELHFPNRKKAEGLRYIIDIYYERNRRKN